MGRSRVEGGSERTTRPRLASLSVAALFIGLTITVAGVPATSPALADITPGCVVDTTGVLGWWRGEDSLVAEVGPDLVGAPTFEDGLVGRGLGFDGSTSASVADFPAVTTALSFEAWARLSNDGLTQAIATRWAFPGTDDGARTFSLTVTPTGDLVFETDETTTRRPEELRAAAPTIYDGSFHHVAVTWDAAQMAIYFDGTPIATRASQGGVLNPAASTPLQLGRSSGLGAGLFLHGVIDEATVWGRALTPVEVAAISASGPDGKCSFAPVQRDKLSSDVAAANDWFGFSVGVSGTTTVVGAPYDTVGLPYNGAAYVYTRTGVAEWTQQATLAAADASTADLVGWSVAIDGDTIVAGSYGNNGGGTDSGAAYVYTRTGGSWTQQAKLLAADAAPYDGFGYSVAISGDTIVVGTPLDQDSGGDSGSAYVFTRSGGVWTQQAKLTSSDSTSGDDFGLSVAIDGNTVIVGSAGHDDAGSDSGSAYVFTRSAGTWTEQAKLDATDGAATDYFGLSVGVHGNVAVVGSPQDDDAGLNSGSAYVFSRVGSTWSQTSKLTASDAGPEDDFGFSVASDGTSIVVGAYLDSVVGLQSGSAYVFRRSGGNWAEQVKLVPDDAAVGDQFGVSVAVSGTIAIGAYLDDDHGNNSGATYMFSP